MKFKSVCKFKICCEELQTVMVPLPDCASGEWGPTKATRLFGLVPIDSQVNYAIWKEFQHFQLTFICRVR